MRMREKRIGAITVGTGLGNSERAVQFAETHEDVWATVGLHPEHLTSTFHHDQSEGGEIEHEFDPVRCEAIARSSKKVVACGETGLDFFRIDENADGQEGRRRQETAFREHLAVAHRVGLPVVIHCRLALGRLSEIMQDEATSGRRVRGVVHSFTGTWEEARPLLDLGLFIAVNGITTFPLKKQADPLQAIDRTIERMPLGRLLLETDAPYLAPAPFRGKRNEPTWVEEVARHVARVRGMSVEEIAAQTIANAIEFFHLS